MNAHLISIIAQISACNARIAAMEAENLHKSMCGDSQLYLESNFWREAEKLEALAETFDVDSNAIGQHVARLRGKGWIEVAGYEAAPNGR